MKKIHLILYLIFYPTYAMSDVWVCNFEDTVNKSKVLQTYIKEGGKYFLFVKNKKISISKTFENYQYIHFVFSKNSHIAVTILDKKTNNAKTVFASMEKDFGQSLSFGKCKNN